MSLKEGAETVVKQSLNVKPGEDVVVLNDGNDQDLIDSLIEVLDDVGADYRLVVYTEPENHGEEPPENVSNVMREADVVIAPTLKSLSHTDARRQANEAGTRVVTMPTVTKEVWKQSLSEDYSKVKELSEKFYDELENVSKVRIVTPSGTDLKLKVDRKFFEKDTGFIREKGDFGNLPAGETDGGVLNAEGRLVIDHFPYADQGTVVEIENGNAVAVKHPESVKGSKLSEQFEKTSCAKKVAELGIGTNSKARLIGNVLQDEKVKGTVHIAFGDNSTYFPENHDKHNSCNVHWDTVCEDPTVWFDGKKVINKGEIVLEDG